MIFFERIRDEVREGHQPANGGRDRLWRARQTVLIADAVSMLSAIVLFVLAIGSVKGFAFTLGLTTLIDVLIVFMFTKPLTLLARTKFFGGGHRHRVWISPPRRSGLARVACREAHCRGSGGSEGRWLDVEVQHPHQPALHRRDLLRLHRPAPSLVHPLGGPDHGLDTRADTARPHLRHRVPRWRGLPAPTQVTDQTVDQMRVALEATGIPGIDEAIINTIGDSEVRVQTDELHPTEEGARGPAAIGEEVGVPPDRSPTA